VIVHTWLIIPTDSLAAYDLAVFIDRFSNWLIDNDEEWTKTTSIYCVWWEFGIAVGRWISIREVTLRRTGDGRPSRLVTRHPVQLSLAIPSWVGAMSSSVGWTSNQPYIGPALRWPWVTVTVAYPTTGSTTARWARCVFRRHGALLLVMYRVGRLRWSSGLPRRRQLGPVWSCQLGIDTRMRRRQLAYSLRSSVGVPQMDQWNHQREFRLDYQRSGRFRRIWTA